MDLETYQARYEALWYYYFACFERTEELDLLMEDIYNLSLEFKGEL